MITLFPRYGLLLICLRMDCSWLICCRSCVSCCVWLFCEACSSAVCRKEICCVMSVSLSSKMSCGMRSGSLSASVGSCDVAVIFSEIECRV